MKSYSGNAVGFKFSFDAIDTLVTSLIKTQSTQLIRRRPNRKLKEISLLKGLLWKTSTASKWW